jgi:hypothetical protein
MLNIRHKWDQIHEKWHMHSFNFGGLAVRDSKMRQRKCCYSVLFSDTMTLWAHSGNHKSNLAPDYEKYSRSSAPPRSVLHYVKRFCARPNIFNIQLSLQKEKCPAQWWIWVVAERPSGRAFLWSIGGLTFGATITPIAQTFVRTITRIAQMVVFLRACVAHMQVHSVTRYKISQNPVDRIQISAPHDYIRSIIYSSARIKFIILNITDEWYQTHEKWQMSCLNFGDLVIRDSKMRRWKILIPRFRIQWHYICILAMISHI